MKIEKFIIYFVVILFLTLISLPIIQGVFNFLPEQELKGIIKEIKRPILSKNTWINKTFQKKFEDWADSKLGLKGFFIKTDNEINYLLFKEIHQKTHNKIIIGKENYLFEESYIKSFIGRDYQELDILDAKINKLKELQEKLKVNGVELVFLISPSKASFYSEYIPKELIFETTDKNPETNYNRIIPMLNKYSVNYFDSLDFLLEKKERSDYPLFSKSGTHWTRYGSCLVLENILRSSRESFDFDLRIPDCSLVDISKEPKFEDKDLSDLTNLWNKKRFLEKLAYPRLKDKTDTANDINLLMIGDSFCWGLLKNIKEDKSVKDYNFYYYFNTDYNHDGQVREIDKSKKAIRDIILNKNLLIIEANETALNDIGFGFIEVALEALK